MPFVTIFCHGKAPSILVASHLLNLYQCSVILHESILVSKQLEARKMTSKFITQCADKFHNSNTKQAARAVKMMIHTITFALSLVGVA
jgi:hypothetical protein